LKKVIGVLILLGILATYLPMMPSEECPEGTHETANRLGSVKACGSLFHCPLIFNKSLSELFPIPFIGRLPLVRLVPFLDELPDFIFHPPRHVYSIQKGDVKV
jgi:hypothetical protein